MKRAVFTAMATTVLAASFSAIAADKETVLASVQMPVMVNQGQNYIEATQSMQLYSGDQLMVMKGGSAQVHYANGCIQTLGANEIAQVGTAESCASLSAAGTHQQVGSTGGGGGGAGLTGSQLLGLGAVAAVSVGIGVKSSEDNDKDKPPISP